MSWAGQIAVLEQLEMHSKLWFENLQENIKMGFTEAGCEGVDRFQQA
jgi:hypothetical protein